MKNLKNSDVVELTQEEMEHTSGGFLFFVVLGTFFIFSFILCFFLE